MKLIRTDVETLYKTKKKNYKNYSNRKFGHGTKH